MYANEIVNEAKKLKESGLNWSRISRQLGVSRSTLREWFSEQKRYVPKLRCEEFELSYFFSKFEDCNDFRKAYYYLLGQYLGDGYISRNGRSYALRISATTKYVDIIAEIKEKMSIILPENSIYVTKCAGCESVTVNSKKMPVIFPQHGIGKKYTRLIKLSEWQMKYFEENSKYLARGLFHSDGCFYKAESNKNRHYYVFTNNSYDIHMIFQKCLTLNGIKFTFNKKTVYGNSAPAWNTLIYRKAEVDKAFRFLGAKS